MNRQIIVTPDVLIPRPETELLLETALDFARDGSGLYAADICTGSGALAVTFAAHMPNVTVYATDISPSALAVARQNAAKSQVNVTFMEGDLLQPFLDAGIRVDLLMCNPPYIPSVDLQTLDVAKHEPTLALDGGEDGLVLVRRFLHNVPAVARPGALVLIEIGADQGAATLDLANDFLNPAHAEIVKDYAGHDRFLKATLP